jgi:hypothetical protein
LAIPTIIWRASLHNPVSGTQRNLVKRIEHGATEMVF